MHAISACARELKTADFRTCANVPSTQSQIMDVASLEKKRRIPPGNFGRAQPKKKANVAKQPTLAVQATQAAGALEPEHWGDLPRMEVMTMLEACEQDDPGNSFGAMETSVLSDFDLKRVLCHALQKKFWEKTPWAGMPKLAPVQKAPGISLSYHKLRCY